MWFRLRLFLFVLALVLGKRSELVRRHGAAEGELSPSDPFEGFNLFGPWTSSSGCTSTGWKGQYSIMGGAIQILSVEVGPESTTFEFNPELVSQVTWILSLFGFFLHAFTMSRRFHD